MGAAAHLGIDLREYDARIRTFIPGYDAMLGLAASTLVAAIPQRSPVILDLGVGTGSLARACAYVKPGARIVGIDEDEDMLAAARRRLPRRFTGLLGSFETVALPVCHAVTASLALHHIPTTARRLRLFRRIYRVLHPGGVVIIADCYLASSLRLRAADRNVWLKHLRESYTAQDARGFLRAWAKEDTYARLTDDTHLLERAGFAVDIVGRRDAFAVVAATKERAPSGVRPVIGHSRAARSGLAL